MSLKAGIVGLPNVGKSTLFNAITKKNILAANFPFATIEPNVGVVIVPDQRLTFLENLYLPERTIPTTYEFIDIAGLVKGAAQGEGLGNKFLSNIKEVDAIVEVVRCFENKDIIHVENNVDPIRDIEIISLELILSDLEVVQNRLNKLGKKAEMTKDKEELVEINLLRKLKENLLQNVRIKDILLTKEETKYLSSYQLITAKPIIYVANVSEQDIINHGNAYSNQVLEYARNNNEPAVIISAKIESELAELEEEEKQEYLKELNIDMSGLDQLISKTYDILGLCTYFTSGKDECRAWTFKRGMNAKECAGIIHTDFEKGFIKAEIMSYQDLLTYQDEQQVKKAGKMRLEGKDYLMQDGDICYFRFNVTK